MNLRTLDKCSWGLAAFCLVSMGLNVGKGVWAIGLRPPSLSSLTGPSLLRVSAADAVSIDYRGERR